MNNPVVRRSCAFLLTAGLFLFGCLYTYRLERTETRTRRAILINELELTSGNGEINVSATTDSLVAVTITPYAWGRDSTDASRTLNNIVITDTVIGTTWHLTAQLPKVRSACGVQFSASAPEGTGLRLNTTNAQVTVSGMTGGITVTTSNGPITLTGTRGAARLSTTNSPITVQVHRGPVNIQTSNGTIECDLAELSPTDSAALRTTNAKVALLVPADISATVDAQTTNGAVTITGFSPITYELQERNHQRARIGSGAAPVTIRTTNGDITIRAR
ncbi:MAG: DUF4097 family beta strand repeat-containing protein [candidate division WOR-3 bacterium]